jgi:hypothetical protein
VSTRLLAAAFLVVMATAAACFVAAFARRRSPRPHVRLAVAGAVIDVLGTLVVVVTARGFGVHVPARFAGVALVHRGFAYAATTLLAAQVATGIAKARGGGALSRLHGPVAGLFLPVYLATYVLAVVAYGWWW